MTRRPSSRAGIALVEFALVVPVLLLMLAGVLNYGRLLRTAGRVAGAARAGAQYGSRSLDNSINTLAIQSAAVNSSPGITGLTVNSARSCKCPDGTSVSCSGTCTGGALLIYIQVTASASASAIFSYAGLPYSGSTTAQATVRVQ